MSLTTTVEDRQKKWDYRFLDLAAMVATWSKDPSTQTGAVIVSPDRGDVFIGYNGFPRLMWDHPDLYANRETKYSRIIHCEMNALLSAGRLARGATLYTYPFASCDRCFVHMLQGGITRFVAPILPTHLEERWGESLKKVRLYATEAGVELCEIEYPGYNSGNETSKAIQEGTGTPNVLGPAVQETPDRRKIRWEMGDDPRYRLPGDIWNGALWSSDHCEFS